MQFVGQIRALANNMKLNDESLSQIHKALHTAEKQDIFQSVIGLIIDSPMGTAVHKIEYTFGVRTGFYCDTLSIFFIDSQLVICIDYKDKEVSALIKQTQSLFEYLTGLSFAELSNSMYTREFVANLPQP